MKQFFLFSLAVLVLTASAIAATITYKMVSYESEAPVTRLCSFNINPPDGGGVDLIAYSDGSLRFKAEDTTQFILNTCK